MHSLWRDIVYATVTDRSTQNAIVAWAPVVILYLLYRAAQRPLMKWPYRLVINATLVIAALCVGFGLTGEYGVPGTAVRMAAALAGWWIETRFGGRFALHDSGSPISRWMSPQSYAAFARWFIIVIGSELGLALIGFGLLLIGKGIFGMLVPTIAGICVWVLVARCAWQAVRPNRRSGLPVSCR